MNDELCANVPGPACLEIDTGNGGEDEERVIVVHNGVHGVGDLGPAAYDWRNPVARIVVTRVR